MAELESVQSRLNGTESQALAAARQAAAANIGKLLQSPSLLQNLQRENFLRSGLDLIEGECCPFCDNEWDIAALREKIGKKLEEAKEATELRETLERDVRPVSLEFLDLETLGGNLCAEANKLKEQLPMIQLAKWVEELRRKRERHHRTERCNALLNEIRSRDLEGIVAQADAPYSRETTWYKI